MPNINITLIIPPKDPHAMALVEAARMLREGLERTGANVEITANRLDTHRFTILFGSHLLHPSAMASLKEGCAIFNLEQLETRQINDANRPYFEMLSRLPVIDYNHKNLAFIQKTLVNERFIHLSFFFSPALASIPTYTADQEEDIDVLFFGSINERRGKILAALTAKKLNVASLFNVYGKERDAYIARAKIVLNLHYYHPGIFEEVRVSYLLANRKAVVAEINADTQVEDDMRQAVAAVPYEALVDTCCRLLENHAERQTLAARGQKILQQRDPIFALNMIRRWAKAHPRRAMPDHLNLGSGKDWKDDCINLDVSDAWQPDIVGDIADSQLFEKRYPSKRWGEMTLTRGMFQTITANDVLEHIPDLTSAMRNCLDLLKEGGTFHIQVPYDLSHGAWQDPTHLRAFNEKSWLYYTRWSWYLGWLDHCFELANQGFALSEFGSGLKKQGASMEQLTHTPRAIDSLRIVLRKRALTAEEKTTAQTMNTKWLIDLNR